MMPEPLYVNHGSTNFEKGERSAVGRSLIGKPWPPETVSDTLKQRTASRYHQWHSQSPGERATLSRPR